MIADTVVALLLYCPRLNTYTLDYGQNYQETYVLAGRSSLSNQNSMGHRILNEDGDPAQDDGL